MVAKKTLHGKTPFHGKSQFDREYYRRFFSKYEQSEFTKYYRWSLGWFRFLKTNCGLFVNPKGRVLEIGSSAGYFSKVLHEKGYDVTGTDISKFIVDKAKKFVPGVNFKIFDIEKNKVEFSQKFDYIIAFEVFEHLIDPSKAIRNSYKLLAKNGLLVFSTPFISKKSLADPTHINVHEHDWWIKKGEEAGFKKIEYKYATFIPFLYRYNGNFSVGFPFKLKNDFVNSTVFLIMRKNE